MSDLAIQVKDLSKRYCIGSSRGYGTVRETIAAAMRAPFRPNRESTVEPMWALHDISFDVKHGQVLGIIGRNGAGKSTLLKILSRITEPTSGRAIIHGRIGSLLEVGTGFHPELSGLENIYLNGAILGMHKAEIRRKLDEIIAFAEIEKFMGTPVKRYSSGMYMRLAFAVAAHLEPEILLVDEVLAVGDAAFQKKCLGKMRDVAKTGRTVLFVSHNMNAIQRLCPHSILLEDGRLAAYDDTVNVVSRYLASGIQDAAPSSAIDVSRVQRSGTGQVYVSAVEYSSGNPRVNCYPYPEGSLEVTLTLVSDAPRSVGSIAVTLYDRNGTKLVNADTLALGQVVELKPGLNRVRLRIEQLHLNPATYVLGWYLSNPVGAVFDFVEAAFDIQVVDLASRGLGIRPRSDGVVTCEFEVVKVEHEAIAA